MDTRRELPIFNHFAADFKKVGPRRAHMEQYFRALGLWNADLVEEIRAYRVENRCIKLREKKNKKVSQLYFEYAVDYGVWNSLLGVGNLSEEDHPWPHPVSAKPDRKDFSEGASWYYQDWLLRNGPLPKSKGESSKAPKSEAPAEDLAAPGPQGQPAVVAETSQESPAAAKDTVARYDPSIPFALQSKRAAAAKAARQSS
ncbi:hypothetical protein FDENT_13159 [Fusarium denticulatum]|uniref:Uncharacterized protein n=1 Tax=Fusarium denticulatum TaxID=48507 RepID=A0A8H5WKK3_9HYPO|nr:hypothetical protein FDENT_13159 [Fusarium denticulatum]